MIAGEEIAGAVAVYSMHKSRAHHSLNPTKHKLALLPVTQWVWFLVVVSTPLSFWAISFRFLKNF